MMLIQLVNNDDSHRHGDFVREVTAISAFDCSEERDATSRTRTFQSLVQKPRWYTFYSGKLRHAAPRHNSCACGLRFDPRICYIPTINIIIVKQTKIV